MCIRRTNTCITFPVLNDKRVKGLKKIDIAQNFWEKIAENLDFVENSNFIKGSTLWVLW